jgi:hypothetical protein
VRMRRPPIESNIPEGSEWPDFSPAEEPIPEDPDFARWVAEAYPGRGQEIIAAQVADLCAVFSPADPFATLPLPRQDPFVSLWSQYWR